ncbi:putative ribonuclease H protein [Citrus sinensis]|nr:putative ribonuclease H protein [Citrus sinensis]
MKLPSPWMIGGDFNAIRRVSEKKGRSARISGMCDLLNGWFHRNHLMEPVFKGPKYTWSRGNLSKRLDRVICNEEWMMMNDEVEVFHLPKLNSDHRPVMANCRKNNFAPTGVKPFRFLAPWLTDERFQPFVENNWRCSLNYTTAVADFINKLGNWNKEIFGNIFKRKKELLARIGGIQLFLEKRHSRSLSKLESKLKRDLEKVLTQEEVLCPIRGVDDAEIRDTVFSMSPMKASGINGLHAIFFQTQRHVTSFVLGRHIIENVIVAQEIIHSMRNKGGKTNQMAIKVDLEKAYDRLSWDFIHETLREIGLPMDLIRIIMECITSVSMQLLWNGELTESFSPSRGIRQGDPLSPYIFIMCIERLSHGINQAVGNGRWKPIRLNRGGIPIMHLFFADDLLLLAEATSAQAQVINEKGTIREIKTTLGFSVTKNLGKYLGLPILHSRVTKATYQGILDKVQQRLSGWNAKHLSLAGRITLVQSVIQALPVYAMQSTKITVSVLTKIEQSCKHFIWSGNADQRKLNLIRWDTLYQPKSCGSLGLKDLSHMNMALLMKIGWGLVNSPNTFWVQVLTSKYKVDTMCLSGSLQTRNGSYLWRAVGKVWDHVLKGTHWALGDGKRVKFWWDLWLSEVDNLQSYAHNPIPDQLINLCVADFSDNNGNWNWHLFAHLLPNHIILKIASVKAPCAYSGKDQCYWAYSNTGHFTAKSAYLSLHQFNNVADKSLWNLAWKWKGPQSIRTCGHHLEDTIHVLRDCIIARQVWLRLVPNILWNNFFDLELTSWIHYNLKNVGLVRREENWPCIFGVALWRIWYWRNQFIHNDANISVANMVLDITHRAAEINASMENICRPGHERIIKWLKWLAPPWPFFKLNTYGARKIAGNASAGGLIRNYCGEWVHGFGMNIGHCTIIGAELWGLFQGLQLAWNIGIRQLLVEVDS